MFKQSKQGKRPNSPYLEKELRKKNLNFVEEELSDNSISAS